nr:hypothetical protein [Tanacetum cinerariifolium]
VKTVNEDVWIHALIDRKKVVVNEASIRRDLRLDDAEGIACLPNAAIFKELGRIGEITKQGGIKGRKQRFLKKSHQLRNIYLHLPMIHYIVTNQAAKIEKLKKIIKKLEGKKKKITYGLKRLYKGRMNEEDLFGLHDLNGDEVFVDVTTSKNIEQDATIAKKERKEQIMMDEQITRDLEAQMQADLEEEQRIAKQKKEPNIGMIAEWDNTQPIMDADCELDAQL